MGESENDEVERTRERPFRCKQCPYRAVNVKSLALHRIEVHGVKKRGRKIERRNKQDKFEACGDEKHTETGDNKSIESVEDDKEMGSDVNDDDEDVNESNDDDDDDDDDDDYKVDGDDSDFSIDDDESSVVEEHTDDDNYSSGNDVNTRKRSCRKKMQVAFQCDQCEFTAPSFDEVEKHFDAEHSGIDPLKCDKCEFTCKLNAQLKKHKNYHIRQRFSCDRVGCQFASDSESRLKVHIDTVHLKLRPFKCKLCHMKFSQKSSMNAHVNGIHKKIRPFKCNQCDYDTYRNIRLKNHIKAVHQGIPYKKNYSRCDQCEFRGTLKEVVKHFDEKHVGIDPLKCEECSFTCKLKEQLGNHKRCRHGINWFKCDICTFETRYQRSLDKHTDAVHLKLRPFSCELCPKMFSNKCDVKRHVNRIHKKIRPHKCSQCNFGSYKRISLENHMKSKHNQQCDYCEYKGITLHEVEEHFDAEHFGVELLKCDECTFTCKLNIQLKKHKRRHTYKCDYCEYKGITLDEVEEHFDAEHLGVELLKCDECIFTCKVNVQLRNHKRKHIHQCDYCEYKGKSSVEVEEHFDAEHFGVELLKCDQCIFTCKLKEQLKKHLKEDHNKKDNYRIKRYQCDKCKFKANAPALMKIHIDSVHLKLRPFSCEFCSTRFKEKGSLKKHVDSIHKKIRRFKCTLCDYDTNKRYVLQNHIKAQHDKTKPHKRSRKITVYGPRATLDPKTLIDAIFQSFPDPRDTITVPSPKELSYECNLCDFTCGFEIKLKAHLSYKHAPVVKFACQECSFKCVSERALRNHFKRIHQDRVMEIIKYACAKCPFRYSSKQSVVAHCRKKHPAKMQLWSCKKCSFKTKERPKYLMHVREHKGLKIFKCSKCDYAGQSEGLLNKHTKVHMKINMKAKERKGLFKRKLNPLSNNTESLSRISVFMVSQKETGGSRNHGNSCFGNDLIKTEEDTTLKHSESDIPCHVTKLKKLCRLCGCRTDDNYPVTDSFPEILVMTGVDTFKDEPNVHPTKMCELCYDKLKTETSFDAVEFKPHTENYCDVCNW